MTAKNTDGTHESTAASTPCKEPVIREYEDLSNNMRHYGNVQFTQLTVFLALTYGLLTLLFARDSALSVCSRTCLKIFGLATAVLFITILLSATVLWGHFAERAAELEVQLGFNQYRRLPGAPKFRCNLRRIGSIAVLLVGVLVFGLWLYLLRSGLPLESRNCTGEESSRVWVKRSHTLFPGVASRDNTEAAQGLAQDRDPARAGIPQALRGRRRT